MTPRKKESVEADGTCAVGKLRTCTLLMTVCSDIKHETRTELLKKHKLVLE